MVRVISIMAAAMFNNIKYVIFLLLMGIGLLLVSVICRTLYFADEKKTQYVLCRWTAYCCWLMEVVLGVRFNIFGEENIPNQPCVIVANHQSIFDGIVFDEILPKHSYVAKQSILKIPVFGWLFALSNPIVIDRRDKAGAMKKIIRQGIRRMQAGIWVVIFPEGVRRGADKVGRYKRGAANLAKSAMQPIVPIYQNSSECFTRRGGYKGTGTINILIGGRIESANKSAKALNKAVYDWTKEHEKLVLACGCENDKIQALNSDPRRY